MTELVNMFRNLDDEAIAWDIYRTLDYGQPEYISQIPAVLDEDGCDRTDDLSKYAGTANEQLAISIIKHSPELLSRYGTDLVRRRSRMFREVMLPEFIRRAGGELPHLLETGLADEELSVRSNSLWAFKKLLPGSEYSNPKRDELFEILRAHFEDAQPSSIEFDFPTLLAQLHPRRARSYFESKGTLDPSHPQFCQMLRNAGELDCDLSAELLDWLFDSILTNKNEIFGDEENALCTILRVAIRKQDASCLSVLERAAKHSDRRVQLLGLSGQIKLLNPHDPIRESVRLVGNSALRSLPVSVRVVGFASIYVELVEENGLVDFASRVPGTQYRNTIKAISLLKATPHLRLLNWMLDELGENPRRALREMRSSEVDSIREIVEAKSNRLNFDSFRVLLYRYLLSKSHDFKDLG